MMVTQRTPFHIEAHRHRLRKWSTAIARVAMQLGHPQLMQSAAAIQNMSGQLGTAAPQTLGSGAAPTLGTQASMASPKIPGQ